MLIQPVDYFLLAWFTLALGSEPRTGGDPIRDMLERDGTPN